MTTSPNESNDILKDELTSNLDEKIRSIFLNESIYKDPRKSKFFSTLNIPSYLRDWLVKKYSTNDGEIDLETVKSFIKEKIPRKEDTQVIRDKLINKNEQVSILAKILVEIDITSGEALIYLPELGIPEKKYQSRIEKHIIDKYAMDNENELLSPEGCWGVVTLEWRLEKSHNKSKEEGRIVCTDFKPFKPYKIELDYYRDARNEFTIQEWIDVIIRAMDYNPDGFEQETQKMWMIARLLPFVENRINIIELAPKGTGKSYLYSQLSKYGWLISGGSISRSKLFYDMNRKKQGLFSKYDFVALDEIQTISFPNKNELQGALKGYLELGEYRVGDYRGIGNSGLILLGNIPEEFQNEYKAVFSKMPEIFKESALLDRFHGFIMGWELPRIKEGLKAKGWSFNVEYFTEVLHRLRDDIQYRAVVDDILEIPLNADTRDVEAIKRLCTGFLKILFPNVTNIMDIDKNEFEEYCLRPAMKMRGIIRYQLYLMDREYSEQIPKIKVK
jgi:ATP-dependent Lon protease